MPAAAEGGPATALGFAMTCSLNSIVEQLALSTCISLISADLSHVRTAGPSLAHEPGVYHQQLSPLSFRTQDAACSALDQSRGHT